MRILPILVACFVMPFAGIAHAATVNSDKGKVSINRGEGFKRISGPTEANPGDMVMVSPAGSGKIVYADGCVQAVKPGAVMAVGKTSPCNTSQKITMRPYLVGESPNQKNQWVPYALGGAAIAGIITGIIITSQDDDNRVRPASP